MEQTYAAQVVRPVKEEDLAEWYEKRGIKPDANGVFAELPYRGDDPPTEKAEILEQVRGNCLRRDVPNLHPRDYTPKTMVYVGGGPTLPLFLEDIKKKCLDDRYDVITSNKTCKWLLSKGVKPNYHLILDPQQKKLKDLQYEEDVDLLLGVQCHPDLFEFAKEKKRRVQKFLAASVTLDSESDKEIARTAVHEGDQRMLGFGGGSMTGTRMIYFAGSRGYRRLEYYGFDGHVTMENNVLRCYAYQKFRGENILETECDDGRKFFTTMSLGRQAEELVKLLKEYPGLDVEIYGDSFLSHVLHLFNDRVRQEAHYRFTAPYEKMMREYHSQGGMGVLGSDSAPRVFMAACQIVKKEGVCSVLDYGCGKGTLVSSINRAFPEVSGVSYHEYDPFVEGKDARPKPADLVFCGDVMEHVEPECVDATIRHIAGLTRKHAIFIIALTPAMKTLPDGRNAHICQKSSDWWLSYLRKNFVVIENQRTPDALTVVCACLPQ